MNLRQLRRLMPPPPAPAPSIDAISTPYLSLEEREKAVLLWRNLHKSANKRGLQVGQCLSPEILYELWKRPCDYCKRPADLTTSGNRLDRNDSSLDYTWANCVPCCGECNKAKGTRSRAEFFAWIDLVYANGSREKKESQFLDEAINLDKPLPGSDLQRSDPYGFGSRLTHKRPRAAAKALPKDQLNTIYWGITKWCPSCQAPRAKMFFGHDANRSDGLQSWCKECRNRRRKEQRCPPPITS